MEEPPKVQCKIINYKDVISGRLQILETEIDEKLFTIINLYGPNKDEISLFETLDNFVSDNEEKTFILGGDFNVVLNENLDKKHDI